MSLPPREQLILDEIEQVLAASDPRLKSMFAAFLRSTLAQPIPATEVIPRYSLRLVVMVCLVIVSTVSVLVIGIRATSSECAGASPGQAAASVAAVRSAECGTSGDVWSKGAR